MSKDQHNQLKESIKKFGFVDPIIINRNPERENVIIGGHQRARIAEELGVDKVPCVELDLKIEKERELNVRLNKNTGSWDWDSLANNFGIETLVNWGFKESELVWAGDYSPNYESNRVSEADLEKAKGKLEIPFESKGAREAWINKWKNMDICCPDCGNIFQIIDQEK